MAAWMIRNCAVREHTADRVNVGRCMFALRAGICPRHGDVAAVQTHFVDTGALTNDFDLPPRPAAEGVLPQKA
jgi:hypothetical protein